MTNILHTEWSDGWGGQEIRIISEIVLIKNHGYHGFLACRKDSEIHKQAIKHNIKVFPLRFGGNLDFLTIYDLVRIIRSNKIDIVNTHSGKDTWVGGIAAKISGVGFIRTRHLSNPINPSRFNFINSLAHHIITTGESIRSNMINDNRINPEKITSIPTGPNLDYFSPKKITRDVARKKFGLNNDEIAFGMLAVLRRFKRHDRFIEMANLLLKKFQNKELIFLIAGEGPQRKKLEELIKKHKLDAKVKLLGHVEEQPEFLACLDAFILCSDSGEGVPQSLMQAMAMNKFIIATDVGSVKDLFDSNNFVLIDKNSQLDLDNKAIEFIKNENRAVDEKKLREYILKNFSDSVMIKKTINIYNKILML